MAHSSEPVLPRGYGSVMHEPVVPPSQQFAYDRFHFAAAVRTGDLLSCSGQIGVDDHGAAIADPEEQFTAAFEGVAAVLDEAGGSWADVFEMTTFHVGLHDHLATFMAVRDRFVSEPWPAWTAIGCSELAVPGGLVEVRVQARLS